MRRYLAIVPLFFFTTLLGFLILLDSSTRDSLPVLAVPRLPLRTLWGTLSALGDSLIYRAYIFWHAQNGTLLVYAALTGFALLVTFAMIRAAKRAYDEQSRIQSYLKELTYEKEKAQNLAKLKSEFLNQVSHELRTPLAVIMGYVDCMMDGLYGQIDSKHKEILKVISKQSIDLKDMIDRILTFSRLEADKARTRTVSFSLTQMLADLKDTYAFIAQQKGVELLWHAPRDELTLQSEPERVKEVVNNLLQNAVKFTAAGYVRLRVRHLAAMDSVVIEVEDTGIGIPRNALASIFEPFVQVNKTSSTNSKGGIGLGLSIVKKHVEHLGGSISVKSELGKGTVFTVTLPRILPSRKKEKTRILGLLKRPVGMRAKARAKSKQPFPLPLPVNAAQEQSALAADSDVR